MHILTRRQKYCEYSCSVCASNLCFFNTEGKHLFFFVFVQQRQLADDEIDGELNSLHIPVFFHLFSRLPPCSALTSTCTATL